MFRLFEGTMVLAEEVGVRGRGEVFGGVVVEHVTEIDGIGGYLWVAIDCRFW